MMSSCQASARPVVLSGAAAGNATGTNATFGQLHSLLSSPHHPHNSFSAGHQREQDIDTLAHHLLQHTHNSQLAHDNVFCGEELPQYNVKQDGKIISCMIPSEVGKDFTVYLQKYTDIDDDLLLDLFLDGEHAAHTILCKNDKEAVIEGFSMQLGLISLFTFAKIEVQILDQDEGTLSSGDVGLIEIKVHRIEILGVNHDVEMAFKPPKVISQGTASEKSKLAGANCVVAGEEVAIEEEDSSHWSYIFCDPEDEPYAVFHFRHLPLELLQAKGILPVENQAVPLPQVEPQEEKHVYTPKRQRESEELSYETEGRPIKHHQADEQPALASGSTDAASQMGNIVPEKGVKKETAPSHTERMKALEAKIQAHKRDIHKHEAIIHEQQAEIHTHHKMIHTYEAQLADFKAQEDIQGSLKEERKSSPIFVGGAQGTGSVIDLTLDNE
ncbi:hypothetical protein EVG20_g5173 [Dentipellis fragilis]|uniref:DUF7918 domain-containing protein n=1 Tax=Dentipellis fragilis TaxID=205917 RepID=A0A4Y9YXQ5_9AGAM|nr:hypothetical protein EVG20_g5173 [Dentipellis fragilis]